MSAEDESMESEGEPAADGSDSGAQSPQHAAHQDSDLEPIATEDAEVIGLGPVAPVVEVVPFHERNRWKLASSLLLVITLFGGALIFGALAGWLSAQDASVLAGSLVGPLLALLGTAVAFFYRDPGSGPRG